MIDHGRALARLLLHAGIAAAAATIIFLPAAATAQQERFERLFQRIVSDDHGSLLFNRKVKKILKSAAMIGACQEVVNWIVNEQDKYLPWVVNETSVGLRYQVLRSEVPLASRVQERVKIIFTSTKSDLDTPVCGGFIHVRGLPEGTRSEKKEAYESRFGGMSREATGADPIDLWRHSVLAQKVMRYADQALRLGAIAARESFAGAPLASAKANEKELPKLNNEFVRFVVQANNIFEAAVGDMRFEQMMPIGTHDCKSIASDLASDLLPASCDPDYFRQLHSNVNVQLTLLGFPAIIDPSPGLLYLDGTREGAAIARISEAKLWELDALFDIVWADNVEKR